MRRFIPSAVLAGIVAVSASAAFAQDETAAVSEAQAQPPAETGLKNESVGLKPQVGVLNFKDATGGATNRGAVGLAYDQNFARAITGGPTNLYAGFSTGGLYSHIGDAGSNFFGANPSISSGGGGSNLALFPVNAKLGYNVSDSMRISAHGGGNVIYNSVPGSMAPELADNVSKHWNIFPNVGGDVDIGLGKQVAVTLRPDWTFTPGVGFFTGTLEVGFALG